jgi:hypothetical protein
VLECWDEDPGADGLSIAGDDNESASTPSPKCERAEWFTQPTRAAVNEHDELLFAEVADHKSIRIA